MCDPESTLGMQQARTGDRTPRYARRVTHVRAQNRELLEHEILPFPLTVGSKFSPQDLSPRWRSIYDFDAFLWQKMFRLLDLA